MLPLLLSSESGAPRKVDVPPPVRFNPIVGVPQNVRFGPDIFFGHRRRGLSAAQKAGLLYEDKVQRELTESNSEYIASPTIHFNDDSGARTIIPDGLLNLPGRVIIVEIKSQHMPEAWWQLDQLYRPVIQQRRPLCPVLCLEICRSYDPAMPFPAEFNLFASLGEAIMSPPAVTLGVLPWRL